MLSCQNGHELCARALLEAGADINYMPPDGLTALMLACQQGHEQCTRALLEAGADRNIVSSGRSALKLAESAGHTAICDLLICDLLEA